MTVVPGACGAIEAAIGRGMAPDPDSRPPNARTWSGDLADALAAADPDPPTVIVSPPRDVPPISALSPRRAPGRRRWALVGGLAAVLLGGSLIVGAPGWPDGDPGPTIVGPRELTVGQQGVYYVEVATGTGVTWTRSGGESTRGAELEVTAVERGPLEIAVRTDEGAESDIDVEVVAAVEAVGISGPARARVGDVVKFQPNVASGIPIHWIGGDGKRRDTRDLDIRVTTAGVLTVELVAQLDEGERTVSHTVTVVP